MTFGKDFSTLTKVLSIDYIELVNYGSTKRFFTHLHTFVEFVHNTNRNLDLLFLHRDRNLRV